MDQNQLALSSVPVNDLLKEIGMRSLASGTESLNNLWTYARSMSWESVQVPQLTGYATWFYTKIQGMIPSLYHQSRLLLTMSNKSKED